MSPKEEKMEWKIKILVDEELFWKRIRMIIPLIRQVRLCKASAFLLCLPCIIIYSFDLVEELYFRSKIDILTFVLIIVMIFLFWYTMWGITLGLKKKAKKMLGGKKFPTEQTLTFNDEEIKTEGPNSMVRVKWEKINIVYENENYWIFGDDFFIVDKRMLTDEQFAFLKKKRDRIRKKKTLY